MTPDPADHLVLADKAAAWLCRRRWAVELDEARGEARLCLIEACRAWDPARGPLEPFLNTRLRYRLLDWTRRAHGDLRKSHVRCQRQPLSLDGVSVETPSNKRDAAPALIETHADRKDPSADAALALVELERVAAAIRQMTPKQQDFLLAEARGLTLLAVEAQWGLKPGNGGGTIHRDRARARLQTLLAETP